MMVSAEDLSFIVQGPIVGTLEDPQLYTKRLLKSIRKYFPGAQIILSTWENEDTNGLIYDNLIISKQPDINRLIYEDGSVHFLSVNAQIISTIRGLEIAYRKYSVKVRSDMLFLNNKILSWITKFGEIGEKHRKWRMFKERILTLPTYNYKRNMCFPFNIADWIYAGLTEDLVMLFDIPLLSMDKVVVRDGCEYPYLPDNIGAEQWIWTRCLEKKIPGFSFFGWRCDNKEILQESEISIAQNFILVSARKMGITSQKCGNCGYAALPIFSSGLYTFCEWKRLYNRYGGGKLKFVWNPLEALVYNIIYFLRTYLRKNNNKTYEKIVGTVRQVRSFLEKGIKG